MPDWRPRRLRQDPRFHRTDVMVYRARQMLRQWVGGMPYSAIASSQGTDVATVRGVISNHLRSLWLARHKWRQAEVRCRAMAMELRLLRVGRECPADQPIETLDPSERTLRALKNAGIHTVNQLRAVDAQHLLEYDRFPKSALVWAILKLDALGLSHRLKREEKRYGSYPTGEDYEDLVGPLPPH